MSLLKNYKGKIKDIISFYQYKNTFENNGPVIFFNLKKPNLYFRYLYLLIKFFNMEGYRVYFPNHIYFYRKIFNGDIYLKLLLEEKLIEFKLPENNSDHLEINDNNLSPEYFAWLLDGKNSNEYYIPMTMHPLFYKTGKWREKIPQTKRKNSVFMIGNFDPNAYSSIEFPLFHVNSRIEILNTLKKESCFLNVNSTSELNHFLKSVSDRKCILIDRRNFSIELENLRSTLGHFHFFMACPGVAIPHSHNLIEALSVGCIPIIQEKYAQMLFPPLENMVNAIIFTDMQQLIKVINMAFEMNQFDLVNMQKNVLKYYNEFLTPKVVIRKILNNEHSRLYLQAEFDSVRHLKLQKAYKKIGIPNPKYT